MEVRLSAVLMWHGMIQWWRDRDVKSVFWCPVGLWFDNDIWEECTATNFRLKKRLCPRGNWSDTRKGVSQLCRYVAGLHNLLRNNLSSWFMSPRCSLISITSPVSQFIHLDFLARILALFCRIRWPKSRSCSATVKISVLYSQLWWWCSLILILMGSQFIPHATSNNCRVPTSTWCSCTFLG